MSTDPNQQQEVVLRQITLGGEVVDQPILDQLRRTFSTARLVHIYATTELGRCFSVTDGLAGFPRSYLDAPSPDGVELSIQQGELCVRSANAMTGYDPHSDQASSPYDPEQWFRTGDLIELRGERVLFVGRNCDMINVGGNKVYPVEVERVIRQLPEVADVRIFGRPSSIAGQLVACQIVPAVGHSPHEVRRRVHQHCQANLDRYACPRLVEIVDHLQLNDAGKLVRRPKEDPSSGPK